MEIVAEIGHGPEYIDHVTQRQYPSMPSVSQIRANARSLVRRIARMSSHSISGEHQPLRIPRSSSAQRGPATSPEKTSKKKSVPPRSPKDSSGGKHGEDGENHPPKQGPAARREKPSEEKSLPIRSGIGGRVDKSGKEGQERPRWR